MHIHYSDSIVMRILGMIAIVVVALVALNAGLALFDYDFFKSDLWTTRLAGVNKPLLVVIGLSGLFLLITFVMGLFAGPVDEVHHRH